MHLIVLYGPPAVGKLTVAKKIANQTGYKIMHLHLTIDLVTSLFDRTTEVYSRLNRSIRLQLIKTAAQEELEGVIFTYGYGHPTADEFIKDLQDLCSEEGITLHFVFLTCSVEELLKRVKGNSRKGTGKIQSKEVLLSALAKRDFGQIPYVKSLVIDTTTLSPEEAAQQIIDHYHLEKRPEA